jgi:hypothetical protein
MKTYSGNKPTYRTSWRELGERAVTVYETDTGRNVDLKMETLS